MDTWGIILLIMVLFGDGNSFQKIVESENFSESYDDFIKSLKEIPAEEMKDKIINLFEERKEPIKEFNANYLKEKMKE